jgi:hypothetical protein
MECNSVCLGIGQFFGNLLIGVGILLVAIFTIYAALQDAREKAAESRAQKMNRLGSEIEKLFRTILCLPVLLYARHRAGRCLYAAKVPPASQDRHTVKYTATNPARFERLWR